MKAFLAIVFGVTTLLALTAAPAHAQVGPGASMTLKVGDKAPDFEFPKPGRAADSKETVKLSDILKDKHLLLAFYPKTFTGGCTKQLCGYRDDFKKFEEAGVDVLAVSADKQEDSDRFRAEYEMPFRVVGDAKHEIINAYGVPLKGEYAQRSVVLIDKRGFVRYVDWEYKIGEDEKPLFDAINALKNDETSEKKADEAKADTVKK